MSNESTSAALGSFHYHAGDYERSATCFSSAINEAKLAVPQEQRVCKSKSSNTDDCSKIPLRKPCCNNIGKEERDHYTLLSLKADEALCRFRSATTGQEHSFSKSTRRSVQKSAAGDRTNSTTAKEGKDVTTYETLWERARITNQKLLDASSQKVCQLWCDGGDVSSTSETLDSSINRMYMVSTCRIQLAQSILMTGVSAAWLDLQKPQVESRVDSSKYKHNTIPIRTLHKSICLAALCFFPPLIMKERSQPSESYFISTLTNLPWREGWLIVTQIFAFLMEKCHEKSVVVVEPLNSLEFAFNCDNIRILGTCIPDQDDLERLQIVIRSVEQMLKVAQLCCGTLDSLERWDKKRSRSSSQDDRVMTPAKRQKRFSTNKKLWREAMLDVKEALSLALCYHSQIGVNPHYRKLRDDNLERALSIDQGGLSRQIYSLTVGLDMLQGRTIDSEEEKLVVKTLYILAPTCVNAAKLLACLLTQEGHFERALTIFQELLEKQSCQENDSKNYSPIHSLQKNVVISYMAYCFAMLGEAEPAVELFLQVFNDDQSCDTVDQKEKSDTIQKQRAQFHGLNNYCTIIQKAGTRRISLLWNLFQTASLTNDLEICVNAARLLKDLSPQDKFISFAFAYSCLKSGVTKDMKSIFEALIVHDNRSSNESMLKLCMNTYEANAILWKLMLIGKSKPSNNLPDIDTFISIKDEMNKLTKMAIERISFLEEEWSDASTSNYFQVWKAHLLNNHGISLVTDRNPVEAMSSFLSATSALQRNSKSLCLTMEPFFNLSLLLWRQGHFVESSNVWLKARGIISSSKITTFEVLKARQNSAVAAYMTAMNDNNGQKKSISKMKRVLNLDFVILDMLILRYEILKRKNEIEGT